jgi:pilus assembly protein CpaF
MQTRPPNLEGKGEADERALLRNAPRMRRVRIIVGVSRPAASPALRALQQAAKI